MVGYSEAIRLLGRAGRIRRFETTPLREARGRVLARDLFGREPLPPFDNSAMDGFCLRSADVESATDGRPVRLAVGGTIFAGGPPPAPAELQGVGAMRIMTGAALPPGLDAVLRVEDAVVERDGGSERLVVRTRVHHGANVRRTGEDVTVGERLADAGRVLSPGLLSLAAGQGLGELDVLAMPRLRLLATGDELVDDPSVALEPGQIRNTSLHFLEAEAARLSLPAVREGVVPDREDEVFDRVRGWMDERRGLAVDDPYEPAVPDVVISTGAVSMGERDFVPRLLERLGFETIVHGVAVRPGRPVLIAQRRDCCMVWIGLPGNVLSTAAGFRFFVLPAVRSLLGLAPLSPPLRARLASPYAKPAGLRFFARCRLRPGEAGMLDAYLERRQGSGMLSALAGSDAYAVLPEEPSFLPAGAVVDVEPDCVGLGE